jgi:hypothetical protein
MKSTITTACLILCLFALLTVASAQEQLNFSQLPLVNSPSPMPSGYGQFGWGNFFYVNPNGWSGAGPGYKLGPQTQDVVFVGGVNCRLVELACFGYLTDSQGFQLISANVAGGYGPTAITVTAYNNGAFLGSAQYFLGTQMRTLNFPSSWGVATEVVFQVTGQPGGLVIYSLSAYTLGG